MKHALLATALCAFAAPLWAQDKPASESAPSPSPSPPSPNAIVDAAAPEEWARIAPEDLLVMTLAPDANGQPRQVIIQLMPPPLSEGWIANIRKLARAQWYDGLSINRVQDNYVVQWGDPDGESDKAKPLPDGLKVMREDDYVVTANALGDADAVEVELSTEEMRKTLREPPEMTEEQREIARQIEEALADPTITEEDLGALIDKFVASLGLPSFEETGENIPALISIRPTRRPYAMQGWHQRDSYAEWVEFWRGWPLANEEKGAWVNQDGKVAAHLPLGKDRPEYYHETTSSLFWPVHCYGMVGVGRGYSPDTGSGAELYTVIGHAPRHLDRNIALVGRVIDGIEHLSSLPRGSGPLGFYTEDEADKRVPILSVRVATDLPESERPRFEYLSTKSRSFERYIEARANRRDPFFIHPAGGIDICNAPVPVRRAAGG